MSFTLDIKTEIAKTDPKKECCIRAQCYGMWLLSRCFTRKNAAHVSESAEAARKMAALAGAVCGISAEISYAISRRRKPAYRITVPQAEDRSRLLTFFGYTGDEIALRINHANFEDSCCYTAFLSGAFLSCGTATDPEKEYHIEFMAQHRMLANDLAALMSRVEGLRFRPQIGVRKGNAYVYIKDSTQCEELLACMAASGAAMRLMQAKMYKEVKNDINRRSNFETANMDKTYSASARQIAAIARISDAGRMQELPEDLRELAQLRLYNPQMSLRELAESLNLSRSSVNYKIRKILQFADKNLPDIDPSDMGIENLLK